MCAAPQTLYVVRHGNTFDTGDVILRVGGRTDLALSESGETQAKKLAEAFANLNIEACYSSPLKRTLQTARAICAERNIDIQNAEFLREIDYGPDEGRPESAVIARLGEEALLAWETQTLIPQDWDVDPQYYREHWKAFAAGLSHEHTLVVTSNGVARFLLDALDLKADDRKMKTGGVSKLTNTNGKWSLNYWGVRPPLQET